MEFDIDIAENLKVSDEEISELLHKVYVEEGFVKPEIAKSVFEASAVRKRGKLFSARNKSDNKFAGMLVVVYPESKDKRFQQSSATELHLLGVKSEFRGKGLGKRLVALALEDLYHAGNPNILLATQKEMHAAHRLYEYLGFCRKENLDFNRSGIMFMAYEKVANE